MTSKNQRPKQKADATKSFFKATATAQKYSLFSSQIQINWCTKSSHSKHFKKMMWSQLNKQINQGKLATKKFLSWFHVYPRYFNQANLGYYYQIWPFILLVSCIGSVPWALLFACWNLCWQYLVYSFNWILLEINDFLKRQCSRCTATHKLIIA